MASDIGAAAIVAPTISGITPRLVSRFRPVQPIVAVMTDERVQRQLLLDWGVYPLMAPFVHDSEEMLQNAIRAAIENGFAQRSDKIVVAAGLPTATALMTNTVRAYYLGTVIGRGEKGFGGRCSGRIVKAENLEEAVAALKAGGGDILVTRILHPDFIPIVRMAKGVILEGVSEISWDIVRMTNPGIVFVAEVPEAMDKLENGMTVTLDGEEQLVYEGLI
jgi:pyruvate kinase